MCSVSYILRPYVTWCGAARALSGLHSPVVSKGPLDGHSLPCHPPAHPSTYALWDSPGTVVVSWEGVFN